MSFAERIRERYPEGLTGVFAIGGTRTTYILAQQRQQADPGKLDLMDTTTYLQGRYQAFILDYFELGGQNMILTGSSFQAFSAERGPAYVAFITQALPMIVGDTFRIFYEEFQIDPYFVGLDAFELLPPNDPGRQMAEELAAFQRQWAYHPEHRRLIWEIASVPLWTFLNAARGDTTALDEELQQASDLRTVYSRLYEWFSDAAYGIQLPTPHFYLGTNKSGAMKIRSLLPLSLSGGEYLRLYYTPYPTLFMSRETIEVMLDDLAFGQRFASQKSDYSGKYSAELAQQEYERVMRLSADPYSTLGLSRRV